MAILFFTVFGFVFSPPANSTCVEALHQLRREHHMEVVNAQTVGDTIVYLLVAKDKTAQVGCRLSD